MNLILASSSPRRKELLSYLEIPFDIEVAHVDETFDPEKDILTNIEELSFRKALPVFQNHKDALVIGSDTIVVQDDEVLGKPKDYEHSVEMLKKLEGRTHRVITAVSLLSPKGSETFSVTCNVHFYPMSEQEIDKYAKSGECFDKAGAYAIQGLGARYIKGIEGDYYAVVGLPIAEIYQRIQKYL